MTAGDQLRADMARALEHAAREAGRVLEFDEREAQTITGGGGRRSRRSAAGPVGCRAGRTDPRERGGQAGRRDPAVREARRRPARAGEPRTGTGEVRPACPGGPVAMGSRPCAHPPPGPGLMARDARRQPASTPGSTPCCWHARNRNPATACRTIRTPRVWPRCAPGNRSTCAPGISLLGFVPPGRPTPTGGYGRP